MPSSYPPRTTRELLRTINPLIFLGPVVFSLAAAYFVATGSFAYRKAELEVFPFFILVPLTALAFMRYCAERRPFFMWHTALLGAVLCREIHFPGTSVGVIVALLALLGYAHRRLDTIRDGFMSPITANLIAAGIFSYFISEFLLDHNWARIPREFKIEYAFRSTLEETVELFGHFALGIVVVLVPALMSRDDDAAGSEPRRDRVDPAVGANGPRADA